MNARHLHEVVGVEETVPDLGVVRRVSSRRPWDEPSWTELERLCFRAEKEGLRGWQQVLPRLKQYLEACPQNAQAWAQLARAHLSQDDRGSALRAAQEASRLSPDTTFGRAVSLLLARSFCEAQRWREALRQCEAALSSQPGDVEALELLITARAGLEDFAGAEAALAALAPLDADRALALLQRLAERSQRAEERKRWLRQAAAWAHCPARVLRDLGEACLVLQQNEEALQHFKRAFAQADGVRDQQLARALGQMHMRAGRVEEALSVFRAAMAALPDCLPLHRACWQLLLKEGRTQEAISILAQGAAVAPPSEAVPIFATLAELQQSLGLNAEALRSWRAATELDSSSVTSWKGMASSAATAGARAEQTKALRQLVQLEPKEAEWRARLAALYSSSEVEEARALYKEALALEPTNAAALQGLAKISNDQGALELFERAARMDPTSEPALLGAARARRARGELAAAAAWYQNLLVVRPGASEALVYMAVAALTDQNLGEARMLLTRAVKVDGRPEPEALAWLAYTKLLLGSTIEAEESLQDTLLQLHEEPARSRVRLQLCVAMLDRGKEEAAQAEVPLLASGSSPVNHRITRLLGDPALRNALAEGRSQDSGLGEDLPGLPMRLGKPLEALLSSGAGPARGSPTHAGTSIGTASSCLGTSTTENSGDGEGWRSSLVEGQNVEVYSKSACRWLAGKVMYLAAETVKVKYLVDGQWCEKVLLRSSDSLRLMVGPPPSEQPQPQPQPAQLPSASPSSSPRAVIGGYGSSVTGVMPPDGPKSGPLSGLPRLGGPVTGTPPMATREPRPPTPVRGEPRRALTPVRSPTAALQPRTSTPVRAAAQVSRPCPPSPRTAEQPRASLASLGSQPPVRQAEEPPARRQWTAAPARDASPGPAEARAPQRRQWTTPPAAGSPVARGTPTPAASIPSAGSQPSAPSSPPKKTGGMLLEQDLVFGTVLGSGGFGSVYRGTYRGQEVAIKRLHPTDGEVSQAQVEEFRKEVANLSALAHPRLIQFVGAAWTPPNLCIVTEFMPNGSLYSLLHNKKATLKQPQKLSMSAQVVEGVDFLHGLSPPFVHRDLKSLNVVLDFSLGVKLCDFGLTQSMEKTHITRRENECGSPRYMAPELFDSRGKITEKVDVWALGCLVLEIHLCKLPHAECQSLPQVMDKTLIRKELPFPKGEAEAVGLDLWTLAELCLEYCPKRRIDAASLLEGLRGLE